MVETRSAALIDARRKYRSDPGGASPRGRSRTRAPDPAEYEQRLARLWRTDHEQLAELSADLPGIANTRRGACKPLPSTVVLAILSGFQRRGRWNVPRKLTTLTVFGGGVVDLRYADFTSPDVEICAYSIMGGQTICCRPR